MVFSACLDTERKSRTRSGRHGNMPHPGPGARESRPGDETPGSPALGLLGWRLGTFGRRRRRRGRFRLGKEPRESRFQGGSPIQGEYVPAYGTVHKSLDRLQVLCGLFVLSFGDETIEFLDRGLDFRLVRTVTGTPLHVLSNSFRGRDGMWHTLSPCHALGQVCCLFRLSMLSTRWVESR